jgi:3-phenylpropionate/trans-cinnamate dioxygenase ferredoxin component
MTWHKIGIAAELFNTINPYQRVDIEDDSILLIQLNNAYYAIKNRCTHQDAPLDGGEIEGDEIICPLHGARFCIKTGEATLPPAYEPVETFPTKLEDGVLFVFI